MRYILILLTFVISCNPAPECDLVCADGEQLDLEACECVPTPPPPTTTTLPPPPPPPVTCALPDEGRGERPCYVTRARAGTRGTTWASSTGLIMAMWRDDELTSLYRGFLKVANRCDDAELEPLGLTRNILITYANQASILHDGGRETGFRDTVGHPSLISLIGEGDLNLGRLENVHRECSKGEQGWCGRTGVFRPMLEGFRDALHALKAEMESVDSSHAGPYDGLQHWSRDNCGGGGIGGALSGVGGAIVGVFKGDSDEPVEEDKDKKKKP